MNSKTQDLIDILKEQRLWLISQCKFFDEYEEPNEDNIKDGDYVESYSPDTVNYFYGMHNEGKSIDTDKLAIFEIVDMETEDDTLYSMQVRLLDSKVGSIIYTGKYNDDSSSIEWIDFEIKMNPMLNGD